MASKKKILTKGQVRRLKDSELLHGLLFDPTNAEKFRTEVRSRMLEDGFANPDRWYRGPDLTEIARLQKQLEKLGKNPARRTLGQELHELAQEMLDSGWRGQGMHDPKVTMKWVRAAVKFERTWDTLEEAGEGAQRHWAAARRHWENWTTEQD